MFDKEKMLEAARFCIGTPFHHQGRVAGVGLDCIGLVIHALRAGGMEINDSLDYARQPQNGRLEEALIAHGFHLAAHGDAGDVLLFRILRSPQHVGIALGNGRMTHAYAPQRRVIETDMGANWQRRLCGIYRYGTE